MSQLLGELKRRNVFRVAALYVAVSWVLLQVTDVLAPAIGLPDWAAGFVALLLIVGFPLALVFAWAFELTPEGVKRTAAVAPGESITTSTGRRLDGLLIVALVAVGALILVDRLLPGAGGDVADSDRVVASETAGLPSIAVLPFADMSPKGDQEYFADGIAEELLNVFAQVKGLSVAGRTSAFAFKGKNADLREIGEVLDVAHILEGSVRKAGDQIRVTAQLIKVDDGYHLWSGTYDGKLDDIFGVQDTIAQAILAELTPQLMGKEGTVVQQVSVPQTDLDAYDLYLISKQRVADGTLDGYLKAAEALDRALAIDPDYVPALVWRGYYELMLSDGEGAWGTMPFEEAVPRARAWIDRAAELDPDSPDALFGLASYFGFTNNKEAAVRYYRLALEAKPTFPVAQNDLAYFLSTQLDIRGANTLLEAALAHDPAYVDANINLANNYRILNDLPAARKLMDRWQRVAPNNPIRIRAESIYAAEQGDLAEAVRFARASVALEPSENFLINFLNRTLLFVGEYDEVLASSMTTFHPFALIDSGDIDAGLALAREQITARPDFYAQQERYVRVLGFAGKWEELARYFDRTWGDVGVLVDAAPVIPPYRELATALHVTNHPLAGDMLAAYERDIDRQKAAGVDWATLDMEESVLRLLQGDEEMALALMEEAFDKGRRAAFFKNHAYLDLVEDRERLGRLITRMDAAINGEREKLGLEPI